MSTSRRMDERTREQTMRSIDETKDNIRRAVEESKRETPRLAQSITDFQNESADTTREITDRFLESQKDVVDSMQSAWAERAGYWVGWMQPWMNGAEPRELADMYARTISSMAENYAAAVRIANNMMFAGIESARAANRYAKDNSKEMSRIVSNNARAISQNTRETTRAQSEIAPEEGQRGEAGRKR